MKRLAATSLGMFVVLTAIAPAAHAGSYTFAIDGHRIRIEAPRNCRSMSCVSISTGRSVGTSGTAGTPASPPAPSPAPVAQAPQPVAPVIPVPPPQATVVTPPPAPPPPVLVAASSRPVEPPQPPKLESPKIEPPKIERPKIELLSPNPPHVDLSGTDTPVVVPRPESKQVVGIAPRNDDEPAYMPLGEWKVSGGKSTVRIERCGVALCGYALTEKSTRGENVLVNMKQEAHDAWTGTVYNRPSDKSYYGTITLEGSDKLHVEACAIGRFWCSTDDWTRLEGGGKS